MAAPAAHWPDPGDGSRYVPGLARWTWSLSKLDAALGSAVIQAKSQAHFTQGFPRFRARALGAIGENLPDQIRVVLIIRSTRLQRLQFLLQRLDQRRLALQAANASAAAALLYPVAGFIAGIQLMQRPHWAIRRAAGIITMHPRRISRHAADLLLDRRTAVTQENRIVIGFGHLAAVEPEQLGRLAEHGLRLDQQNLAAAFQVAIEALLVTQGNALLILKQRP